MQEWSESIYVYKIMYQRNQKNLKKSWIYLIINLQFITLQQIHQELHQVDPEHLNITAHEISVLNNKEDKMSSGYYYGPMANGGQLRHGHDGNKVDEDGSSDGSQAARRNRPSDWISAE